MFRPIAVIVKILNPLKIVPIKDVYHNMNVSYLGRTVIVCFTKKELVAVIDSIYLGIHFITT